MRNIIILNAKAHNKYLTDEYLDELPTESILRFCQFIDRMDFVKKLQLDPSNYNQKCMTNSEIARLHIQ